MERIQDRQLVNDDMLWERIDGHTGMLGCHDSDIKTLKKGQDDIEKAFENLKIVNEQRILGYRAEIFEHVKSAIQDIKTEFKQVIVDLRNDIFEPMAKSSSEVERRVGRIEKSNYVVIGGATALTFFALYHTEVAAFFKELVK